ncbi:MAG: hypothetical protein ACT4TC_05120 [Myxococcaceae bacterium]
MVLQVYGRLYGECLTRTFRAIGKNAWTLLLPIALVAAFVLAAQLFGGMGLAGGILLNLVYSALLSSYLYFVGELVTESRVSVNEFGRSIGVFFWSVVNHFFVLWIVDYVLETALRNSRMLGLISIALNFLVFILMPSLEVIYLRGMSGGIAILSRAFDFLQQSWIEWFAPNLVVGGVLYLVVFRSPLLGFGLFAALPLGLLLHVAFVFRGFVFNALDGSSHRQRMFKYRNQQSITKEPP